MKVRPDKNLKSLKLNIFLLGNFWHLYLKKIKGTWIPSVKVNIFFTGHHRVRRRGARRWGPRGDGSHRRAHRRDRSQLILVRYPKTVALLRAASVLEAGCSTRHHRHLQDEKDRDAKRRLQSKLHQGTVTINPINLITKLQKKLNSLSFKLPAVVCCCKLNNTRICGEHLLTSPNTNTGFYQLPDAAASKCTARCC